MNVLKFIKLVGEKRQPKMSKSSVQKDEVFRAALEAYLDGQECDIDRAITFGFLYGFGEFLANGHNKKYSAATCREILRTFRKYLRIAMADGSVPYIDVMPSVIEKLDSEYWQDSASEKKQDTTILQDSPVKDSISSMLRFLDFWTTKKSMDANSTSSDRIERDEALQNKCTAIYLFCMMTCGLEIKDALAIKRNWEGKEIPDSVYVEKYGVRIPLSPTAKKLVEMYNKDAMCTDHLFFTLDNKKYKGDLDNAAKLIESHIAKYIWRRQLPLFKKRSVFIDWINCAIESGLPISDAEIIWRCHLGEIEVASALKSIQAAQAKLNGSDEGLGEIWYLMSIIPSSIKRDKFLKILVSSGILGEENEAKRRVYAPEEKFKDKERGEFAVFTRYIFFRGTPIQAEFANSFSPYAYVIKDAARTRFAQIREAELVNLQIMLRDFPDAVELVDGQKWLDEHNAQIVEGCKAIIRSGNLAGKEAKVVSIKGKKSGKPTYIIEYVEGVIKFQTNLEGVQLDIVPA